MFFGCRKAIRYFFIIRWSISRWSPEEEGEHVLRRRSLYQGKRVEECKIFFKACRCGAPFCGESGEAQSYPAALTLECDQEVPTTNAEADDNCGSTTVTYVDYYENTPWVADLGGGNGEQKSW